MPKQRRRSRARSFFQQFTRNSKGALFLAVWRRVRLGKFCVSLDHAIAAIGVSLVVGVFNHLARVGINSQFNVYGMYYAAFTLMLLLVAAYVLAKTQRKNSVMLSFVLIAAHVGIIFQVLYLILAMTNVLEFSGPSARYARFLYYGLAAWFFIAIFRAIQIVVGQRMIKAVALTALFVLVTYVPLFFVPAQYYWVPRYKSSDVQDDRVNAEATFYSQQRMIRKQADGLLPQRARVIDLYFIGFGAYAYQDVFMKEVLSIKSLFDERFDTHGRSVALINNAKTVEEVPIASLTNLSMILKQIAKRMDLKEDVLFLYLTTHGSESHKLSVDFWPLSLNTIDPSELRSALDESGIRWRIVVISACYSGGFIEPLKDEHTIVITSARADRQSFGCGSGRDFTYFGKALFDEALRETHSLTAAFDVALKNITEQEAREQLTPSEPQMFVPPNFKLNLKLLEQRLARVSSARPASAADPMEKH